MTAFTPSLRSVTFIRQDADPTAGSALNTAARIRRFSEAFTVLVNPAPTRDKITLDVTMAQQFNFTWSLTEHPVESYTVNDHFRRNNNDFTVTGILTDSPLVPPVPVTSYRAYDLFQRLKKFAETGEPMFVATSLHIEPMAVITAIGVSRSPEDGGSVPVSITIREVRFGTVDLHQATFDDVAGGYGAGGAADGGAQSPSLESIGDDIETLLRVAAA